MAKIGRIWTAAVAWILIIGLVASCAQKPASSSAYAAVPFVWENASVYFLLTDRFNNGNTANDYSYGRGLDADGNPVPGIRESEGSFHGGDFAGITQKIEEGYFTDLGISAIWVTPPYEQIHGYHSADGFAFYAYHGYWALDYTQPDANYGTEKEFKEMVDAAHGQGIRILMDVVLNHPGYTTMIDAAEYGFGEYKTGWEDYYYGDPTALSSAAEKSYLTGSSSDWQNWWGTDWIRSDDGLAGYDAGGTSDTLLTLSGLPDFKTENEKEVGLPPVLVSKWTGEGRLEQESAELDKFFTENNLPRTVLNYEIKWLTDWVKEYGIDGFRCDTAKHVSLSSWKTLKEQASSAFDEWKTENPDQVLDDTPFWTVGEVWDHGVVKDAFYTEASFDAIINFSFRKNIMNISILPKLYAFMSDTMRKDGINVMSYISSHDVTLYTRSNLIKGGTALLLAPGTIEIYYGDETARPAAWPDSPYADLKLRSDMNWDSIDEKVLAHFRILGQFRARHPAVGAGENIQIFEKPYIFARVYESGTYKDGIIAVITEPDRMVDVPVSSVFENGESVRNAYDNSTMLVADGKVTCSSGSTGTILLEENTKQ